MPDLFLDLPDLDEVVVVMLRIEERQVDGSSSFLFSGEAIP